MPNSILWIGLVVLWVFVLFPILADRHPRIRRTTDTALATRVLHRGDSKRRKGSGRTRKKRSARTSRKRHHGNDAEDPMSTAAEGAGTEAEEEHPGGSAEYDMAADYLDHDDETAGDESDAGEPESGETDFDSDSVFEPDRDPGEDDFADSAVETGELEPAGPVADVAPARIPPVRTAAPRPPVAPEFDEHDPEFVPTRRGRGGYDPEADAIARAARYTFRQRAVVGLVLAAVLCGGLAVAVSPLLWWGCGGAALSLVTYLGYLRKQVRVEQEIRRRRSSRLPGQVQDPAERGSLAGGERSARAARPGMDRDTARALRRRSHLLEPDDEDPVFEHLDAYDASIARTVRNRATGGDVRRAAGA
ncbi:gephyrin-like molybdotransferase receptor GlpR [Nocardia sp. NPDC024068]|uniref:divisome protein SepX/GlpR n=1 Tax=Nocardia sp. NPDC024068 TaxID=3157197 RepID=UPI0033ED4F0A